MIDVKICRYDCYIYIYIMYIHVGVNKPNCKTWIWIWAMIISYQVSFQPLVRICK